MESVDAAGAALAPPLAGDPLLVEDDERRDVMGLAVERGEDEDVPVGARAPHVVMALEAGADDHVAKPIGVAALCSRVRAVSRRITVLPLAVRGAGHRPRGA